MIGIEGILPHDGLRLEGPDLTDLDRLKPNAEVSLLW